MYIKLDSLMKECFQQTTVVGRHLSECRNHGYTASRRASTGSTGARTDLHSEPGEETGCKGKPACARTELEQALSLSPVTKAKHKISIIEFKKP